MFELEFGHSNEGTGTRKRALPLRHFPLAQTLSSQFPASSSSKPRRKLLATCWRERDLTQYL